MTVSVPAKSNTSVVAYHHTQDGVKGYILNVGSSQVFLEEAAADKLGRYFIWEEPEQPPAGDAVG